MPRARPKRPSPTAPAASAPLVHLTPWLVLAIVAAFWVAGAGVELLRATHWAHYIYLADAFLHGSLSLVRMPNDAGDMAVVGGRLYVIYGPFPALLLMPLVPIFGRDTPDALVLVLTGLAGLWAFQRWLERVGASADRTRLACAVLTLGLGTAMHYGAPMANVWLHAQITALALQCFALMFAAEGRAWSAGVALALSVLTRPTVTLAAPLVGWELWNARATTSTRNAAPAAELVALALPVGAAAALHGLYNWARFGNALDAGYLHITFDAEFQRRIANYGPFHLHYLADNLSGWLFRLPTMAGGRLAPDPHGMSLLITTPYLLLALWPRAWTVREWIAVGCAVVIAVPSLLYYNDGWSQFGQRFALDWVALAIFVAARGANRAPKSLVLALTLWGAAIGAWGLQWFRANNLH